MVNFVKNDDKASLTLTIGVQIRKIRPKASKRLIGLKRIHWGSNSLVQIVGAQLGFKFFYARFDLKSL